MIKNAFITGAGKRIGKAIALRLADEGWNIALHYNASSADAEVLKSEILKKNVSCVCVQADLLSEAQTKNSFTEAVSSLGPVTALINNASLFEKDSLADLSSEMLDQHMNVNMRAPLLLSQMMSMQELSAQGQAGSIINIIDQRVHNLRPGFLSYTLSKASLWTLTQILAMELAPHIRVNAIGPGPTLKSKRQTDEQFAKQCEDVPLKLGATPEEIAQGVSFLLSAQSITGEFISMDGGQHLPSAIVSEEE